MTRYALMPALFVLSALSARANEEPANLRVMTFNIRYGTAPDGDNAWPHRREMVFDVIREFDPDVLGLQEALRMQLDELAKELPQYSAVGTGREADGGGEYSAILYRRERFDVCSADTFWLSNTPQVPGSTSWGNQSPRICTWARFLDRQTGARFHVFNTHWDDQSQQSREKSGQLIGDRVAGVNDPAEPVIVMGDFNVGEGNPARKPLAAAGLRDSFRDLHDDATEVGTFNAFRGRTDGEKIDAVLVSDHLATVAAEIDRTQRDGQFPSDHFPVTAVLRLNQGR